MSSIIDRPSLLAYFLWPRNSNKDNPLKPAKTNVVGSGTAVIIISPLGEPPGLATPETSARTIIADESMMEPPRRRTEARRLRASAGTEWAAAKARFEQELLDKK